MGITAAIINNRRILLVKRRNIPFIGNPGIWTFVSGSTKRNETHDEAACREISEETGIRKQSLILLKKKINVVKVDLKKNKQFYDDFYFFKSNTRRVKLNLESSDYRWISIDEIKKHKNYTNVFLDERFIIETIKSLIK